VQNTTAVATQTPQKVKKNAGTSLGHWVFAQYRARGLRKVQNTTAVATHSPQKVKKNAGTSLGHWVFAQNRFLKGSPLAGDEKVHFVVEQLIEKHQAF